jgi:NAD(P)H dehydrogenase (quinone)
MTIAAPHQRRLRIARPPLLTLRVLVCAKVWSRTRQRKVQHGGQETTLFSVITNLLHFGMTVVGLPYSHQGQMTISEIVGGSPYGATTVAGSSGERQPSLTELEGASHQGQLIAALSNKLFDS